jgi:hypothetical protein
MKSLLQKLLQKKGIETAENLSVDERTIFDNYDRVLSKETLTIEDIKKFLQTQVTIIENKWKDYDSTNAKKAELIPYHTVYKTLLQTIDAPLVEKRALEDYLVQQING